MRNEDETLPAADEGPVQRTVRPCAPVAEVVCYETPRYLKPPMQTYELRQFDGFRALPPGTHQLHTQAALISLIDAERDFWRVESDKWRAAFETAVTALAKAKPTMYRHAPTAEYSEFCNALDEARIFLGA